MTFHGFEIDVLWNRIDTLEYELNRLQDRVDYLEKLQRPEFYNPVVPHNFTPEETAAWRRAGLPKALDK